MNTLLEHIEAHAAATPQAIALVGPTGSMTYGRLADAVVALTLALPPKRTARDSLVAVLGDNTPGWAVADLALMNAGYCSLPLPPFFTDGQLQHALDSSGAGWVLTADTDRIVGLRETTGTPHPLNIAGETWWLIEMPGTSTIDRPAGTAKITFTSGSTGQPKGVCLSAEAMLQVAQSLAEATGLHSDDRHLCVLPLSTLLENIAGLYAPLLRGASTLLPGLAAVGVQGAASFDPSRCLEMLGRTRATSLITVPALLQALMATSPADDPRRRTLRFVALGGAVVAPTTIAMAHRLGWPVQVGYGLSECASVLCLNTDAAHRVGSVGRPLPHVSLRIDDAGVIHARGSAFLGYLGHPQPVTDWVDTGDIGRIDADGFVYIEGRRKNLFITAYGRNVSPEWVEAALQAEAPLLQAVADGEGRRFNVAVLTALPESRPEAIRAAVDRANAHLPDYARIQAWIVADAPFSHTNGLATTTGKPQRTAVLSRFADQLDALTLAHPPLPETTEHPMKPTLYDRLETVTAPQRGAMLTIPLVQTALDGRITREAYLAFLTEAFHHVRHTVPLMMACGARLGADAGWLQPLISEYITEEIGHEKWILDDIRACGGDAEAVVAAGPCAATELMLSYAYDGIQRGNPLSFFGMVYVLEGASTALALKAADGLKQSLGLKASALRYLRSHGAVDQEHVQFFTNLVNRIDRVEDQDAILHAATMFYELYANILRSIEVTSVRAAA